MTLVTGAIMLLAIPVIASQVQAALPLTPVPTFNVQNDENGANDQPGQKDLTKQGVGTNGPGDLWTMWQWDETSLSGGNTGDACSLFDTDNDSKVNFAVCVTIQSNPAVQAPISPRVYTCGDGKVDRCTSTYTQISPINTACATNRNADSPFGGGGKDTQAICHIDLADVGGAASASLVNTCSYPSEQPTSAPSDCVLIPRDAFIRVTKITTAATSATFDFSLGVQGQTATTPSAFDNVAGAVAPGTTTALVGIRSDQKYDLTEILPDSNWALDSASCAGATGTGSSNGTRTGLKIGGIDASPDNQLTCTFTNRQLTGAIRIIKEAASSTTKLNGAHFTINSAGDFVTGSGTNATGTVCTDGLPFGSYSVNETTPPNGYGLDTTNPRSVTVDSAGTCASGAKEVTFKNAVVLGTINIEKDDENGDPLNGATFTLYTDVAPVGGDRNDGGNTDPVTALSCTTGATQDGKCTISNVPLGEYWIVETGVPDGYSQAADQHVSIGVGSAPATGQTKLVQFVNTPVPGTIVITKRGLNNQPLAGAVFTLHTRNALETEPGLNSSTGKTCTSLANGTCTITGVDPGLYWLVETTTPNGYATVDPEAIEVGLGSDPSQGQTVPVTIDDPVVPGTIVINKTGINGTTLNGAVFTLYRDVAPVGGSKDAGGVTDPVTSPALTCTTGADGAGRCEIDDVPLGNYWVVETTVPNGYTKAPDQAVTVGLGGAPNAGDTDTLQFADPVVPGTVSITKTDDAATPNRLNGAEFTLYTDVSPFGGSINAGGNDDPITSPAKKCTTTGNGTCNITGVAPGRYWVVETVTPDGYDTAAPQAIEVKVGDEAPGVGDNVPLTFVDERQHRVVVVVCHEGTDSLFPSDVKIGSETKTSLAAGSLTDAQQKALCDTGGASFGNISGHGTVQADIDIGGPGS